MRPHLSEVRSYPRDPVDGTQRPPVGRSRLAGSRPLVVDPATSRMRSWTQKVPVDV